MKTQTKSKNMKRGVFNILVSKIVDKKLITKTEERKGFLGVCGKHSIGIYYSSEGAFPRWIATHLQSGFMITDDDNKNNCMDYAKAMLSDTERFKKGKERIDKVFRKAKIKYPLIPFNKSQLK